MKQLFLSAALTALGVLALNPSSSAQTTPPLRGSVSATELTPYVEELWNGTCSAAGTAKRIVDDIDSRANIRGGLMKNNLKGQTVYWEHYALSSSIRVHRADSTEAQDTYSEGAARHTGYTYTTRESKDATHYTERTDFMDEGYCCIWDGFESFDAHHKKAGKVDDKSNSGAASLHVWYTPLKVHVGSAETAVPVYKDCTGAMDITLTDTQDRWVIDGYTLKVTSMNTEIFTVEAAEVTTDADGKARIRIHGVKEGKGRLRVYMYLAQPENNCYVEVEDYFDVEVLEAEKWTYDIVVHDEFTLPAHDYTMHGSFSVVASLGEDDLPHWQMLDVVPVTRSGGGSFHAQGEFLTPSVREDGVVLGFDIQGIYNRTGGAVAANLNTGLEGIAYALSGGQMELQTTDSKNVITAMLTLLEEGSWSYLFNVQMMEQLSGSSVSGTDMYALEAAGKEIEAKQQAEAQEQAKADGKKPKKKSALRELREGLKALRELENFEIPDINIDPSSLTGGSAAYSPQQAEAKAAQMAYIKEHGCLVIPDLTQLLLPHFGNWMKEGEKAGAGGDASWMEVRGTLTMSKEK